MVDAGERPNKKIHQYLCEPSLIYQSYCSGAGIMERRHNWILPLFFWILYTSQAQASDWNWEETGDDGFPGRNDRSCDGFPVQLHCPGNDVIKITAAMYGRQNSHQCSGSRAVTHNTSCNLPQAKEIIAHKCNNRSECTFHVSNKLFPDPCPGTKKYLETSFDCVKYMFSCPGPLTGIGEEDIFDVNALPQPGTWMRDPLSNPEHVFFVPSGRIVHEYISWEDFLKGDPTTNYHLQHSVAPGNVVVYDRNLFYVKANSRNIVRYGLINKMRTKESSLPGHDSYVYSDITLAVDEDGLWVTYVSEEGFVKISLLDKEELTVAKTWTTSLRRSDSLHTFLICGIMYSVHPMSGDISYSFNTKLGKGSSSPSIPFDKDRGFRLHEYTMRSFLRYNASSVFYDPRNRLLYLWDTQSGDAVVYKLHFNNENDGRTGTTMSSMRKHWKSTSSPQISAHAIPKRPAKSEPASVPRPIRTSCLPQSRDHIHWPLTAAGDTAMIGCLEGTGEYAIWKCEVTSPLQDPEWGIAGPDTSKCMTWAVDILKKYNAGFIDRTFAFESLAAGVSRHEERITGKWMQVISDLMEKLLDDSILPSKQRANTIVRCVTNIASILLKKKKAWDELGKDQSVILVHELMTSLRRAAFVVADAVSLYPSEYNDKEVFVTPNDMMVIQVEVRKTWLRYLMNELSTLFPNEDTYKQTADYGSDVMEVPNDVIMRQNGNGQFAIVFTLFRGIEENVFHDESGWEIDSSLISATLRHPISQFTGSSRPVSITLKHKAGYEDSRRCAYWIYSERNNTGNWSSDGCTLEYSNSTHSTCECHRLGTFALLRHVQKGLLEFDGVLALEVVTAVGISITIICLIGCVLTLSIFQNLQNGRTTILKHTCICLLVAEIIFLVGVNQTGSRIVSAIMAGLLQYFIVAAFTWIVLEGFQLYRILCEVFEEKSRAKWFYGIGYGIPAIIVAVSAAFKYSDYGSDWGCLISVQSDLIWSVIVSVSLAVLAKVSLIGATMYKIRTQRLAFADSVKVSSVRLFLKEAIAVLFLVLTTWILGVAWMNVRSTVLACLFCVFNIFQGILFVALYCVLPKKVRQEYIKALERVSCCGNQAKDSYATNSMTFTKHFAPGRFIRSETGTSTREQSRFPWEATTPKTVDSFPFTSEVAADIIGSREQPLLENWVRNEGPQNFTMNQSYEQRNGMHRRQEDEVFLPRAHDITTQTLIPTPHYHPQYNRIHRHQHSELLHHAPNSGFEQIVDRNKYRTGISAAPMQHHRSNTMAQGRPIRSNPQFGPVSHSQPRIRDFTVPYPVAHSHENGPYYWELDPPFLRAPCLAHPDAHRDSGIGSQNLPPNSIVHRLTNGMQRRSVELGRQSKLMLAGSDRAINRRSPLPIRIQTFTSSPDGRRKELAYSEDEGQGSSFEDSENHNLCARSNIAASRCARHDDMSISPSQSHERALEVSNGERRLKSDNSDSDDPITTDCSGSSASSFRHEYQCSSNREMLV